jgi:DNA-binding NarL/FixJ family response regulator
LERPKLRDPIGVYISCVNREGLTLSKIRALLADDHREMLEHVSKLLSADGCIVVGTASDGQAAIAAAVKLRPDVVVLDISMPILSGIQAAEHMKEANPSIKIVFLALLADTDICRAALETGALGYVLKSRLETDLIPALQLARVGSRFVSPGCETPD